MDYLPGYTGFTAKSYLQVTDCPFSTNFDPPSSHCPYPNDKQTNLRYILIDIIKARVRLVPLLSLTALSWSCRRFIAWGRPNEVIAPYDLVVLLMLALKTPPIARNCFSGWLTITYEGFSDLFFFEIAILQLSLTRAISCSFPIYWSNSFFFEIAAFWQILSLLLV